MCSGSLIFFAVIGYAQTDKIRQADSLFSAKQFTQSLELYHKVFEEKKYSPAMLLKMAYINEGLGKTGATLYYLKLYHLATDDEQALKKAEELAIKYKLSGYEINGGHRFTHWLIKKKLFIQVALAAALLAVAIVLFLQRQRQHERPWAIFSTAFVLAVLLLNINNLNNPTSVIVSSDKTYLMEGPSAGADVFAVISNGNLLESLDHEDVWLKVKWLDKEAYVKKTDVLAVEL